MLIYGLSLIPMPRKGWSIANTFAKEENARKYAKSIQHRFFECEVSKGIHTYGGGLGVKPKKQDVFRVWVK